MKDESDDKTADMLGDAPPQKRGVGRPKKYESQAARQRAYRARLKEDGKREVSRIVRDVRDESRPLVSDIIDLSEVRSAPRR